MRKLFTIFLALFLVLSLSGAVFAEENPDSQDTVVTYDTGVSAKWFVEVPSALVLNSDVKDGVVKANGTWATNQYLSITTDGSVNMYLNGVETADFMEVPVQFPGIALYGKYHNEVETEETVVVDQNNIMGDLQFGKWQGSVIFSISMNTDAAYRGGEISKTQVTFDSITKQLGDGTYSIMKYAPSAESLFFNDALIDTEKTVTITAGNGDVAVELLDGNYALTDGNKYWLFTVPDLVSKEVISDDDITEVVTIYTVNEFIEFGNAVTANTQYKDVTVDNNPKVYVLLNSDLDLTGAVGPSANYGQMAIGDGSQKLFRGTFDGQGHKISNRTLTGNWRYSCSLFRTVGDGFTLKNVMFENLQNTVEDRMTRDIGSVVGILSGTATFDNVDVKDCKVNGSTKVGVLVGKVQTGSTVTFKNCDLTDCTVTASSYTATLVGQYEASGNHGSATIISENNMYTNCVDGTGKALDESNASA